LDEKLRVIDKGYIQDIDNKLVDLSIISIKNNYMKLFRFVLNRYKSRLYSINTRLNYEYLIAVAMVCGNIEALYIITNFDSVGVLKCLETFWSVQILDYAISSNKREIFNWLAKNGVILNPEEIFKRLIRGNNKNEINTKILDLIYDIDKTVIDKSAKYFDECNDDNENIKIITIDNNNNNNNGFYCYISIIQYGSENFLSWLESHN
jgi:hypothetical protein